MNRNKTVMQLYSEHKGKVSDKWTRYLWEYDILFREIRAKSIRMLEIGVQNGGGLEIWSEYFRNGLKFIGCDINPDCAALRFDDPRIALIIGDANNDVTQKEILSHSEVLDIIIDDGSHFSGDVIRSFLKYFPNLVDGGIYVAEDMHTSYWMEYEGGLFDPFSSITFFKRLVDILNSEHWGIGRNPADILAGFGAKYGVEFDLEILHHIHSIKFVNSLCIIYKSQPLDNQLGPRFVAGSTAEVSAEMEQFQNSLLVPPPQFSNPWTFRTRPPDEELPEIEEEVKVLSAHIIGNEQIILQKEQTIQSMNKILSTQQSKLDQAAQEVQSLNVELGEIYRSRAWKLIQFLRRIRVWIIPKNSARERIARLILYQVNRIMSYGRTHGIKALIARIFKNSPTFSDYGIASSLPVEGSLNEILPEQNMLKMNISEQVQTFPTPLPVFLTPFTWRQLNVIIDDINSDSLFGRVTEAIICSILLAEKWKCDLRIVADVEPENKQFFGDVMHLNNIPWNRNVEFLTVNSEISNAELPIGPGDLFLTTSWRAAAKILNGVSDKKIIYLLQEDERTKPLNSENIDRCEEVFRNERIKFVVSTKMLYEHLISAGFENMRENGIWFEPARPDTLFFPDVERPAGRKNFLFTYSGNSEELPKLGYRAIEEAIQKGIFDINEWNIFSLGKVARKFIPPHSFILKRYQNLDWDEQISLVRKTDLCLSLTGAPLLWPDYHPLDLVASGAVVLTDFLQEESAVVYSKNLLYCNPKVDEVVQGLARGSALVHNPDLRMQNFRENGIIKDWRKSFQDGLASMEKWGFDVSP